MMTPSSPSLNLSVGLATSIPTNKCGLSSQKDTSSEPSSTPSQKPLNIFSTVDGSDIPDEATVWSLLELAGWKYKRADFEGTLWQHRVVTDKGYEYMVPVTAGIPPFVEVWWIFKELSQA